MSVKVTQLDAQQESEDQRLPSLRSVKLICLGCREPDWEFLKERMTGVGLHPDYWYWTDSPYDYLQNLRSEQFDFGLLSHCDWDDTYQNEDLLALLTAIRESGLRLGLLVLAQNIDTECSEQLLNLNCDFHEIQQGWYSPVIGTLIKRTLIQSDSHGELQRLTELNVQRTKRERAEAEMILNQQRSLLQELIHQAGGFPVEHLMRSADAKEPQLDSHAELSVQYQETLRNFVIMGAGRVESELQTLNHELLDLSRTPRDLLKLHLDAVQDLINGLGQRSSKHVMDRADLMLIELLLMMAEKYRKQAA